MFIYLFITSILVNLIFISIDILPGLRRNIRKKKEVFIAKRQNKSDSVRQILEQSFEMADSRKTMMPMREQSHFISELNSLRWRLFKRDDLDIYNYPKAFLFAGLTDYCISTQDSGLIQKVASSFDKFITNEGKPNFHFNEVDQVPFGVASINLFRLTGEKKYKTFADFVYSKLSSWSDSESKIVQYRRQGHSFYFNDVLGMICPFLVRYGHYFDKSEPVNLAFMQLNYFIKNGVNKDSYLPFHGIGHNNIGLGPSNWGRGIGWYILALSEYLKFYKEPSFLEYTEGLFSTLNAMKKSDDTWSQFPGTSNKFDASTTTLIMYSLNYIDLTSYSKTQILNTLKKYIINGAIDSTSGDTYNINYYSRSFGYSELSQGVLLMLLSTKKKYRNFIKT